MTGNDNANSNPNNIVFTIKETKLYVPAVTLSAKDTTKNYQNFIVKDLKDQSIGMNIKQKVRIKIRQMNIDIFSNKFFFEFVDYFF